MQTKQTILIIDDIKENIDVLVGLLHNYDLIPSLDGVTALKILEHEDIDLILLDIMMPEMDGFEVCILIKQNSKIKNIPIIFLTGKNSPTDIENGFKLGAVDYISKPFEPNELIMRVKTHLELRGYQKNLEKKVKDEILKNKQQQHMIYQQSKQAALGELLMHIAHQWTQPLSELGSINTLMLAKAKLGLEVDAQKQLDSQYRSQEVIKFMSETLDTFKNFYQPTDNRTYFLIKDSLSHVITIIGATFDYENIQVIVHSYEVKEIYANMNEFEQVILSILNNARNIFKQRRIKNPVINIKIENRKVSISDNGGGIDENIYEEIFSPFKSGYESSGIGLALTKSIIDKNDGVITATNNSDGAVFTIEFLQWMD
ncbi:MAG: histidine kinase [Sulfurimonas sp.]|nr:MAG: histidine kinase [Sulfurimonas sp.]